VRRGGGWFGNSNLSFSLSSLMSEEGYEENTPLNNKTRVKKTENARKLRKFG
jgi:hypothetical protein